MEDHLTESALARRAKKPAVGVVREWVRASPGPFTRGAGVEDE